MQVRIPPPAPQASHFTGRGVRGTRRAHEGDPLPRRRTGSRRPLPPYGTFSTEDRALAVAQGGETAHRQGGPTVRQAGWICATAPGIEVKRPRTGARRTGWSSSCRGRKDAVWKAPRVSAFSTPSCLPMCGRSIVVAVLLWDYAFAGRNDPDRSRLPSRHLLTSLVAARTYGIPALTTSGNIAPHWTLGPPEPTARQRSRSPDHRYLAGLSPVPAASRCTG